LLAAAVGAVLVAVDDLAAEVDAAGAAAGAAVVAAAAGLVFVAFCIPPWPLQVPLPVEVVVVPSEQGVVAPAAGAADAAGAAGAGGAGFCTPPWPLQVPLPVEVVVVPSLQLVAAVSAARLGIAKTNSNSGAATRPATVIFFMNLHSLVLFRSEALIVNRFLTDAISLNVWAGTVKC
jgi:hypothetical protein